MLHLASCLKMSFLCDNMVSRLRKRICLSKTVFVISPADVFSLKPKAVHGTLVPMKNLRVEFFLGVVAAVSRPVKTLSLLSWEGPGVDCQSARHVGDSCPQKC